MVALKLFFFFSFLISISYEGTCAITTRADKYIKCRDKAPTDSNNNVCCFLKTKSDFKRCVELRKVDIDGDKFKETKEAIKKGTYDYWLMDNYTGFDEYKNKEITIGDISSLRCSNSSKFLKYFGLFAIFFIFF